ncbi:hypothetical protein VYU27_007804 [Nannochloropsis oceanica]
MPNTLSFVPVAVPILGWLLAMLLIFVVHFLASWRRRSHLVGHLPKVFLWIDPRSFLASLLRQKWNAESFDRLVLEEFEKRDYPPVIVIIGPLPWVAPSFISNDATLITEMLLLGNKQEEQNEDEEEYTPPPSPPPSPPSSSLKPNLNSDTPPPVAPFPQQSPGKEKGEEEEEEGPWEVEWRERRRRKAEEELRVIKAAKERAAQELDVFYNARTDRFALR